MTSWHGFLTRREDGTLRITAGQLRAVGRAVAVVCGPGHFAEWQAAAEQFVTDRSCHTCDFERSRYCLAWKAEIPDDVLDAGCEKHATTGAPF